MIANILTWSLYANFTFAPNMSKPCPMGINYTTALPYRRVVAQYIFLYSGRDEESILCRWHIIHDTLYCNIPMFTSHWFSKLRVNWNVYFWHYNITVIRALQCTVLFTRDTRLGGVIVGVRSECWTLAVRTPAESYQRLYLKNRTCCFLAWCSAFYRLEHGEHWEGNGKPSILAAPTLSKENGTAHQNHI